MVLKWIVGRYAVRKIFAHSVDIDADDLPEQGLHILAVALRILLRTGVAHAEVQITVRTKFNAPAAVILRGADNLQQAAGGLA